MMLIILFMLHLVFTCNILNFYRIPKTLLVIYCYDQHLFLPRFPGLQARQTQKITFGFGM